MYLAVTVNTPNSEDEENQTNLVYRMPINGYKSSKNIVI